MFSNQRDLVLQTLLQLINSDRELKKILTFLCKCFFNRSIFFHFPVKKTKRAEYALPAFSRKIPAELFLKETENKGIAINQEDRKTVSYVDVFQRVAILYIYIAEDFRIFLLNTWEKPAKQWTLMVWDFLLPQFNFLGKEQSVPGFSIWETARVKKQHSLIYKIKSI